MLWNRVFCSGARARDAQNTLLLIGIALFGASCSRNASPPVQRLAIPRFENLSGDDSLNWMGRAASEVLAAELAGSRTISVISLSTLNDTNRVLGPRPLAAPGISTERAAALLSGADRILYGRISQTASKLRLDASVFDASHQKIDSTLDATAPESEGIIRLADALAKQLTTPVRPFETQNAAALREYCTGLESPEPAAAVQAFSRAVHVDPDFGEAYVAWTQLWVAQHDRAKAQRILALAAARGNAIAELSRARLEVIAADLSGNLSASARALETLGRFNPADIGLLRQLAQVNLNARRYTHAAANLKKAAALDPNDAVLLNQLGYAEMYAGNVAEATKALDQYARIEPDDPNALDSLGDVNFYLGQFAQAEKYYRQAYDKDNSFNNGGELTKAAHARLMIGDIPGADRIFNQYLDARRKANDPSLEFRRAEWEFLSGRSRQAIARMDTFTRNLPPDLAPVMAPEAYAQLAVWELELGDRVRARELALKAPSQRGSGAALMARFLTEPPARPAEWSATAAQTLPGAAQERARKLVLAYTLLLQKEWQAAQPLLLELYQHTAPDPTQILPVLLAWTYVETGRFEDAAPLVAANPVPHTAPEIFASLAFPRLLFLRAAVLAKQGRNAEAGRDYRLFLTLSGPDAKAFGEEAEARQAITR